MEWRSVKGAEVAFFPGDYADSWCREQANNLSLAGKRTDSREQRENPEIRRSLASVTKMNQGPEIQGSFSLKVFDKPLS